MTLKSILECERRSLERMRRYQLPHGAKKFGAVLAIAGFVLLFVNAFVWDSEVMRQGTKYGMLIGLLMVVISRERVEDERVSQLRSQAFAYAFIFGVMIAIAQPFINYLAEQIFDNDPEGFQGLGDFQILWTLLVVQIAYFELIKRLSQ